MLIAWVVFGCKNTDVHRGTRQMGGKTAQLVPTH